MNPPLITPTSTIGEIVATRPLLATVFERVGIDFCCGGKATLAAACARRGLDVAMFAAVLEAVPDPATAPKSDPNTMTLTALADHIAATHHAYTKSELPVLVEQARRVAAKHRESDPRLTTVAEIVRELADEMLHHMTEEERVLFPLIRTLELTGELPYHVRTIADPIDQMEREHTDAGASLARLRKLTYGFTPPADACNTHRALLAGLARFEQDLHHHVHLENNLLFPRARALEALGFTGASI